MGTRETKELSIKRTKIILCPWRGVLRKVLLGECLKKRFYKTIRWSCPLFFQSILSVVIIHVPPCCAQAKPVENFKITQIV